MSSISIQTRGFADLTEITSAQDSAMLIIRDDNGVKKVSAKNLKADIKALIDTAQIQNTLNQITFPGAGTHNGIFRGKNLGSSVTSAQWAEIKAGTFNDLYIGDYWTIGGIDWVIAAFDYYLGTGDTECTAHHVVIVPRGVLYNAQMNSTSTTNGAYFGSAMYKTGLNSAKETINNAFGSAHILKHRNQLQNDVSNDGYPSGGAWYDSTVELMTEENVYGCKIFGAMANGSTIPKNYEVDKSQFPLFQLRPGMQSVRDWYWLRDVVSSVSFAYVSGFGYCNYGIANNSAGVRPAFCIYQS